MGLICIIIYIQNSYLSIIVFAAQANIRSGGKEYKDLMNRSEVLKGCVLNIIDRVFHKLEMPGLAKFCIKTGSTYLHSFIIKEWDGSAFDN